MIQAASLGGVGLLCGAVAGWVGILSAPGLEATAARVATAYQVLLVLLPVTLLLWTWSNLRVGAWTPYARFGRAVGLLLAVGVVGAVLASLAFVALATQVSLLFGRLDPAQFQQALYAELGRPRVIAVIAVTTASALLLAIWAHWQIRRQAR